ncbi:MAG TPA: DUF5671 domain-containing protein, partial [Candidatus Limnocylindria bacterium]
MQIIRRLYLYGMSGITLGVLLTGLNNLFVVVFHSLGLGRGTLGSGFSGDREQLSLAIALTVVGLLVWTVHWLLIERSLRPANPAATEERSSGIRALYLSIVLAGLLVFGVLAGVQLLQHVARLLFGVERGPDFEFLDIDAGAAMATILVTGLAWGYHAAIRRRDLAVAPMSGPGAWIPRVYLYGATLLGLVMAAINVGTLLRLAVGAAAGPAPDFSDPGFTRRAAADALAGLVGWGVVFVAHWWYATSLLRGEGWRAISERQARLRLAYYVAAIDAAAIATVIFGAQAVSSALGLALGVERDFASASALETVGGPLLALLPWLIAWFVHQRWMVAEASASELPDRPGSMGRLVAAAVGLVGIGAFAGGAGGALGLLLDILLGGNRIEGGLWRHELADFLAIGIVGAVLWLWNWTSLQGRRSVNPAEEAHSTVRRSYLLLIVGVGLLVSLASLAVLLYQLFNAILGVDRFGNAASTVSAALGALLVAGGLAAYHGLVERRDRALRDSTRAAATDIAAEEPALPATVARTLLLR